MYKLLLIPLLWVLTGCVIVNGHNNFYIVCDHTVDKNNLKQMEHSHCDKKLPLQYQFKF